MSERNDYKETVADLLIVSLIAAIVLPVVYILDNMHI